MPPAFRKRRNLLVLGSYALATLHCIVTFTIGEPYPSLQGPMFAGHLQQGRTIHVPFYREKDRASRLPAHDRLLRHETLAIPIQMNFPRLAPSLKGTASRQFLIGHSLRTNSPHLGNSSNFSGVEWFTYRIHAPLGAPPELIGEENLFND